MLTIIAVFLIWCIIKLALEVRVGYDVVDKNVRVLIPSIVIGLHTWCWYLAIRQILIVFEREAPLPSVKICVGYEEHIVT